MEFISENIFDSGVGETFLIGTIYLPQFQPIIDSFGLDATKAFDYTKKMVCGGTTTIPMSFPKTTWDDDTKEFSDEVETINVDIESDGKTIKDYKKKIGKLNDKLTNLQDSLTAIAMSITLYAAATAIPFSAAAGAAGIKSTIGQLKGLKNIIGDVNELLDDLHLSGGALDSIIPGAGTTITVLLDLIEGTVTILDAIPLP